MERWSRNRSLLVLGAVIMVAGVAIFVPSWRPSLRIIAGGILLLVVPGLAWSWIFWERGQLDLLERAILSLALSICLVSLSVFLGSRLGFPPSPLNVIAETLAITAIPGLISIGRRIGRRPQAEES